ncbi:MAG TPA: acetolactate decarboxylase [Stellaceae bacterium]
MSRRHLLRIGIASGACATCGLPSGGFTAEPTGDSITAVQGAGYDLWFVGAQRDTIMNGKLAAALDLNTLAGEEHLYGLGPLEQLRGEITIADSRPSLARIGPDGSVEVAESFNAGAPFFVWSSVPQWRRVPIPAEIRSYADLERFVPQAAAAAGLDAAQPLPFLVHGREELIEFHVLNRVGDPPHNMEAHKKIQVTFELDKAEAVIVGFHSMRHRGVFTPGDSNIHIHFQTPDNRTSGHIQKLELGPDAVLSLPIAA